MTPKEMTEAPLVQLGQIPEDGLQKVLLGEDLR